MEKEILFRLTAADFDWSYTKGTGAGGQKRNKTSSAVHCMHRASGAHGYSEASRSQHDNKAEAFKRCTETEKFKTWLRLETMKRNGQQAQIDAQIEKELTRTKIEIKIDGKWTPVKASQLVDDPNDFVFEPGE